MVPHRYFLSLEDNLFRIFGGDRIKGLMTAFQIEDLPIESQMLTNALDEAQRKVESYFFDIRKQLFEYDQVLNTQRDKVRCCSCGGLPTCGHCVRYLLVVSMAHCPDSVCTTQSVAHTPNTNHPAGVW